MMEGRPRYFERLESCIGSRMFRISSLRSWEVFQLKKIKGFVSVDLLPRGKLINSKNFLQLVTLITIGPTKEEAVVRKEEVSDFWCTLQMDVPFSCLVLAAS